MQATLIANSKPSIPALCKQVSWPSPEPSIPALHKQLLCHVQTRDSSSVQATLMAKSRTVDSSAPQATLMSRPSPRFQRSTSNSPVARGGSRGVSCPVFTCSSTREIHSSGPGFLNSSIREILYSRHDSQVLTNPSADTSSPNSKTPKTAAGRKSKVLPRFLDPSLTRLVWESQKTSHNKSKERGLTLSRS